MTRLGASVRTYRTDAPRRSMLATYCMCGWSSRPADMMPADNRGDVHQVAFVCVAHSAMRNG
jgi:hypothetical protein